MATAYTNLLGFALPVTGELSGTWGQTVNDSITELVEDSIAGSATANVTSGDWTLTTTGSGAANEARCAILIPTGTPGVSRNIIAPGQSKAYIVDNQSNGAVVVKASATTGATIAAGTSALVAWTGSDFELIGQAIANATGTLPVNKGGTGATTLTGVLKGNGTSAFTASNVDLTSEVSNQLPLANGGTGANLSDPNADRILFWDDSASSVGWLEAGSGVSISGTTITATGTGGTVTSVGGTGTVNGITLTGTVTSTGNLTLGGTLSGVNLTTQVTGTLPVANGGTGLTGGTSGGIPYYSSASAITSSAALAADNVVFGGGAGVAPFSSNLLARAAAVTSGTYVRAIGYADTVVALGNTGTGINIDVVSGGVFTATLTGSCTFTLRYPVATGSSSFTLVLTNDGTAGRSVAWAGGTFRFPGGAASLGRTTAANATDIWVFFTPNGGSTWYGNIAMKNMAA